MNNKMTINTHLTNKSKKLTQKQNRNRFMDTENILTLTDGRGVGEIGEKGKGIKKYKLVVIE